MLRDEFGYTPKISREQFFITGFAERKMILVTDLIRRCIDKHDELLRNTHMKKTPDPFKTHNNSSIASGSMVGKASSHLGPSHAEFGPRTDDVTSRETSHALPVMRTIADDSTYSVNRAFSNTLSGTGARATSSSLLRHNTQMNASIRSQGSTAEPSLYRTGYSRENSSFNDGLVQSRTKKLLTHTHTNDFNTNSRTILPQDEIDNLSEIDRGEFYVDNTHGEHVYMGSNTVPPQNSDDGIEGTGKTSDSFGISSRSWIGGSVERHLRSNGYADVSLQVISMPIITPFLVSHVYYD